MPPAAKRLRPSLPLVSHSAATQRLLLRLSRSSLIDAALAWLKDAQCPRPVTRAPTRRRGDEDTDDEGEGNDDEEEDGGDAFRAVRERYEDLSGEKGSKMAIVRHIENDWRRGLSWRQLAMLDMQLLLEKPSSRAWSAYKIHYADDSPIPPPPTLSTLSNLLSSHLAHTHPHHLRVSLPPSSVLPTLHLTLLPCPPTHPAPSTSTTLLIPLLPSPYILLTPPTPSPSFEPFLLHAIQTAYGSAAGLHEVGARAKDPVALRELVLEREAQGAWKRLRTGRDEAQVLDPVAMEVDETAPREEYVDEALRDRITLGQSGPRLERAKEIAEVFGHDGAPTLPSLSYALTLPPSTASERDDPFTFTLALKGSDVVAGVKGLVEGGWADDGLPGWLGLAPELGRTEQVKVKVDEDGEWGVEDEGED